VTALAVVLVLENLWKKDDAEENKGAQSTARLI